MGMNENDIKCYVKRKLGHGVIGVELTDDMLDDVIRDTKRWFIQRGANKEYYSMPVTRGTTTYKLPDRIVDVYAVYLSESSIASVTGTDAFSYASGYYFGQMYSGQGEGAGYRFSQMPYSDMLQRMQYLEMIKRLWGADTDWEYDAPSRVLRLMPNPSANPAGILLEISSSVLDTQKLVPEDEDLFLRWALAEGRETLGEIRSKFDTVATGAGDRSLNGAELLDRSEREKETLNRQILDRKLPTFIVVG